MTMAPQVDPAEPDWENQGPDLDAIGLASEFAEHVRRSGIPPEERQQALGNWLDQLIAGLEAEIDPGHD
jgi:hypothetical protein